MPRSRSELPPSQRQYVPAAMPDFVEFQYPRLVREPPSAVEWLHEIKHDGYRLQVHVRAGKVTVWTRNALDWTAKFPEIAADCAALPACILDSELVALRPGGASDFSALRAAISPGKTAGLVLQVFDLLWLDQEDLRPYALMMRKAMLEDLLEQHPSQRLRYVGEVPQGGRALLKSACALGLEGIVSKRRDAPYRSGRGDTWVKAKCRPGQEVFIGGWVQKPGGVFKALLVGTYEGGELRYAGSVKTGFGAEPGLLRRLQALEVPKPVFVDGPRPMSENRWVPPELVARVGFAEWTASGKLRQASFKGFREDKLAMEVSRET